MTLVKNRLNKWMHLTTDGCTIFASDPVRSAHKDMKPQAVKYVLMAQDMNRAVTFYRDTMGFTEAFSSPHWSELRFGDAILALHGGGDGSRTRTGLSLQYEDVSNAFHAAIASGATKVQAPEHREGEPIILATIEDPEGNEIMLTQYVGDS